MHLLELPADLWAIICSFACLDGGATGCALSLVSRQVNRIVDADRYYSVSLPDWNSIRRFSAVVDRLRGVVGVRHLFVATLPFSGDGCYRHYGEWDTFDESGSSSVQTFASRNPPIHLMSALQLIRSIFEAVHGTLLTLSGFGLPPVVPGEMPALCNLVLHYNADISQFPDIQTLWPRETAEQKHRLPLLRRMYLLGEIACRQTGHIAKRATAIEIIHCSRPGIEMIGPIEQLVAAFPNSSPSSRLVRVVLEPTPELYGCGFMRAASLRSKYQATRDTIKHSEWLVNTVELRSFPPYRHPSAEDQRNQWSSIIRGDRGPWDLHDSTPTFQRKLSTKTNGVFLEDDSKSRSQSK
jgi:hypothetical protein